MAANKIYRLIVPHLTIFTLILVLVSCKVIENLSEGGCPSFCDQNQQLTKAQIDICAAKCVRTKLAINEDCVKDCVTKNPEGSALCELSCKLSPTNEEPKVKVENGINKEKEISSDDAMNMVGTMMNVHSRINNMMDCMMDGLNHQMNYGLLNDFFKSKFFDEGSTKDEGKGFLLTTDLIGSDKKDKDADGVQNKLSGIEKPVYHRFIIIKNIPLFSFFNEESDDDDKDKTNKIIIDEDENKDTNGNKKKLYAVKVETEITMTSKNRLSTWLKNWVENPRFKKGVMLVICGLLLLTSSYLMLSLLCRHWFQRHQQFKECEYEIQGQCNHLIPVDEKLLFIIKCNGEEKKKEPTDNVYVPTPLPEKIPI